MAAFFRRLNLYDGLVEAWGETLRVFHHARNILVFGQDVAILLLSLALTPLGVRPGTLHGESDRPHTNVLVRHQQIDRHPQATWGMPAR